MNQGSKQQETEELMARSFLLAEMIDYQESSIVSRTIVTKDTGTVTLFAFDEGEGLSEHTAPFDALVYVIEGTTEITISGKPMTLKQGEMVIMPAHKPHAVRASGRFKMMLVMIKS
jgi:quercetin dioxygenase-like cupin family protein